MDNAKKRFGERVLFFRKKRQYTQETLRDLSGISQAEISRIERGRYQEIKVETIVNLAIAFEVDPAELVRATEFATLFGQAATLANEPSYSGTPYTVYFASALTGLNEEQFREIQELDEQVHKICQGYTAHSVVLYRPRLKTAPQTNPDIPEYDVYAIDRRIVSASDIVILAAPFPSLGAGMEVQLAYQGCASLVILEKRRVKVSKMVLGCPVRKVIVQYELPFGLANKLPAALDNVISDLANLRFADTASLDENKELEVGDRIRRLREQRGLEPEALAKMVGIEAAGIEAIETLPEQVSNPSLKLLRRIARALESSEAYIITGHQIPISQWHPLFSEHMQVLVNVAKDEGMKAQDRDLLWSKHVEEFQYELTRPGSKRAEVGDRKYWLSKYRQLKIDSNGNKLFE
jgi:transcriptional regulator with XRE-family HTH domain